MGTFFTSEQAQVWHHVFSHSPIEVLDQALASGLVEKTCSLGGRDLLFAFLARPSDSFVIGTRQWWGSPESVRLSSGKVLQWLAPRLSDVQNAKSNIPEPAREETQVLASLASALLRRPDVDPLARHTMHIAQGPAFARPVSSLQVALAANLVPVVELIGQWAVRNGRQADFRKQLEELDSSGMPPIHRAVASSRVTLLGYLLEQGLSPSAEDDRGRPAIFHVRDKQSLDALLSAGADPSQKVNGKSILDAWSSQDQKGSDTPHQELVDHLLGKGLGNTQETLATGAWLWLSKTPLALSWFDGQANLRIVQSWKQGWKEKMLPALDGSALYGLSRSVSSGPLRGEVNFAAHMGFRWVKSREAQEVWPALLDDPAQAIAPHPTQIRKGLTDWGVLALGAARHLASQVPVSARSYQANVSLFSDSQEKLRAGMQERAAAPEWEEHMLRAAQVLQRPKNGPVWRDVAIALTAHAKNQVQCRDTLSLEVAEEKLDFMLKALATGAKLPVAGSREQGATPLNILASAHTAIRTQKERSPDGEFPPGLCRKWTALATAVLADTAMFNTFCSQEDQFRTADCLSFIRKTFAPMVEQSEGYLALLPEPARKRAMQAFPLLQQWNADSFRELEMARMDQQLPSPGERKAPRQRF